jgi:hypothetical protein
MKTSVAFTLLAVLAASCSASVRNRQTVAVQQQQQQQRGINYGDNPFGQDFGLFAQGVNDGGADLGAYIEPQQQQQLGYSGQSGDRQLQAVQGLGPRGHDVRGGDGKESSESSEVVDIGLWIMDSSMDYFCQS